MKKLFTVIASSLLFMLPFCGVAHAEESWDDVIGYIKADCSHFVFDEENRDKLTNELDCFVEKGAEREEVLKVYHDAVQKLLLRREEVKYNCRVLSAWAYCTLREAGAECKQITIRASKMGGGIFQHSAVLVSRTESGGKNWYVCDISFMSEFKNEKFALIRLEDYIKLFGDRFLGIMINDDKFTKWDSITGRGIVEGRDIAAWLAIVAGDIESAQSVIRSQMTPKLKVMSSRRRVRCDMEIVANLQAGAGFLPWRDIDCIVSAE